MSFWSIFTGAAMFNAFDLTGVAKWNYETLEYEPYDLPDNCPLALPLDDENMKAEINCANCRKKATFGRCYISKAIHNPHGFGYPVCESCHNEEFEKERKKYGNTIKRLL